MVADSSWCGNLVFLAARGIGIFPLLLSGKVVQVDGGGEPVTGIAGVTVSVSDEHTGELFGETVTGADGGYSVFVGPFPVAIVEIEVDESTVPPNLEYRVSDHERHSVVVGPLGGSVYFRFREVLSTISFVVFDDSDADGVWDADEEEAGPGVAIVIEDPRGRADTIATDESGVWTANLTTSGLHTLSLRQEMVNAGLRVTGDRLPVSFEYIGDPISLPDIGVYLESPIRILPGSDP